MHGRPRKVMADTQVIEKPRRWDVPFWEEGRGTVRCPPMDEATVDRLLQLPPFAQMKPTRRLRQILASDTRLRPFEDRQVVVRQGDYGNSAFLVLDGQVKVLQDLPRAEVGQSRPRRRGLIQDLLQRWTNSKAAESRDSTQYHQGLTAGDDPADSSSDSDTNLPIFRVPAKRLAEAGGQTLGPPSMFGELAALGRLPREATVVSAGQSQLLEIRWQGLRDLRQADDSFKQQIDENYRRLGLAATLQESPLLGFLREPASADVAARVTADASFETFGRFDWHGSYQQLRQRQADPLQEEPIISRAGDAPDGLILIRAGFARLSRPVGAGERTISYLRKGDTFGLAELVHHARTGEAAPLTSTLRAVGYVDIVRIPTPTFDQLILPRLDPQLLPALPATPGRPQRDVPLPVLKAAPAEPAPNVHPGMLEFLVENRYVNGTSTMLIDLDRCTRCDDCVTACATGHNNNPRFVRHGRTYGHHMVANACMHCEDPVCMIGCPTGAIHRTEASGEVVINDKTCIGCSICADACPYENIRMVQIRSAPQDDALMVSPGTGRPILKATKCDLCVEHHGGPACQRACPHDALQMVNLGDVAELARGVNRG